MPPADEPCDGRRLLPRRAGRAPAGQRRPCKVVIGAGAVDAAGAPLAGGVIGIFDAAAEADETPPVLAGICRSPPRARASTSASRPTSRRRRPSSFRRAASRSTSPAGVGADPLRRRAAARRRCRPRAPATITVTADGSGGQRRGLVAARVHDAASRCRRSRSPRCSRTRPARSRRRSTSSCATWAPTDVPLAGLRLEDSQGRRRSAGRDAGAGGYALVVTVDVRPERRGATRRRAPGRCCCGSTRASAPTGCRTAARRCA